MGKETIYYVSDTKWFSHASGKYASKYDALKAHLDYITSSKDFRLGIGDKNVILNNSLKADKRVNSRIAFSLVFALPNDLSEDEVKLWIEEIRKVLATQNNMHEEDIFIGYHESKGISEKGNKHLHIVGVNIDKDGKSIALGRGKNEIDKLNKSLQQLILTHGYAIRRDQAPMGHIGTRLRQDDELRRDYVAYVETKQVYREVLKELQVKKRKQEEERKRQEELQKLQAKKIEVLKAMEKNFRDVKTDYMRFEKNLSSTGKQKFSQFFEVSHNTMELVKKANTNDELRQIVMNYNQEAKKIFDLIAMINKEIERKNQAKQQQVKQEQKPTQTQPQVQKSEPKTQAQTTPKPQEQKPTPSMGPSIVQSSQPKPAQEPTPKPQSTQLTSQKPQSTKPTQSQEQKPAQGILQSKPIQPQPIPEQEEKPKVEATKSEVKQKPAIKSQPQVKVEAQKIETPPHKLEPEAKPAELPKQQEPIKEEKKEHRYILFYESEEDADWYWQEYIANDVDEYTRTETYRLPTRLNQEHVNKLLKIAKKGHVIDILISRKEYFYDNYDMLDQIKDFVNIMVIDKPEQEQGQKRKQGREEQEQDKGYHRPTM